jgi:hypothetical protein
MTRRLKVLLALLLATLFAGETQGGILLFQREVSVNRSVNIFDTDQFDLDLILGNDYFVPTNAITLFDSLVISPADVGMTYDATLINDPAFSTVAERLTDAKKEFIKVSLTEDQLNGLTEQRGWAENFFFGRASPPDLAGETVNRVSLHIDGFDFHLAVTDGDPAALVAQPLIDGPEFDLRFTVSIYGVPEPAAAQLLLAGLTVLGLTPVCRRRQSFTSPKSC